MSKRIIKIRFALNLSEDDLGFARLYHELLEIEEGSQGATPAAILSTKRRILLKVLHGYCQNTSPASTNSVTNAATKVEPTFPLFARPHASIEKATAEEETIHMPGDTGEPEQDMTLDEIFNEGMRSFIDLDEPQSIINEG